jgi:hypothetical protein
VWLVVVAPNLTKIIHEHDADEWLCRVPGAGLTRLGGGAWIVEPNHQSKYVANAQQCARPGRRSLGKITMSHENVVSVFESYEDAKQFTKSPAVIHVIE